MTKVLIIEETLTTDSLACRIANQWRDWNMRRQNWISEKEEIQRYVFATDTTKTSNSQLPWSNKTTIPKLCQIRDNLFANYMATMFPKRKNIVWVADDPKDDTLAKTEAVEGYISWVIDRPEFYNEIAKCVLDYIDYGNCFAVPEWVDGRNKATGDPKTQLGYVGPKIRRVSPIDIVFNPAAPSFIESPKIIRSVISLGEIKELLDRQSITPEEREFAKELYDYMRKIRAQTADYPGEQTTKDAIYDISGFDNYRNYLCSNQVEVLTFYGDIYDQEKDTFQRNQIVKIVDRHRIMFQGPNPSFFGSAPIFHVGWRVRPDNIWAMGPLDNLVGMQYRIDHLENMKADVWDLTRFPVFKCKGFVDDFNWEPGEKIIVDEQGDVELLAPDVQALQANTEIAILEQKMEEMAGSPKEAMGFRTPGEKTKYEVQRLENAASRIFQNKISQFEMHLVEPSLNAMLELARRTMDETVIRVFDDNLKINSFSTLTPEDITGNGRIRPMAARHFAEQAQLLQDLNAFYGSASGQDPAVLMHFSGVKQAHMWEKLLEIEDFEIVQDYIRISEQQEAQQLQNIASENMAKNTMTPSGMGNDYDQATVDEALQNSSGPGPAQRASAPVARPANNQAPPGTPGAGGY